MLKCHFYDGICNKLLIIQSNIVQGKFTWLEISDFQQNPIKFSKLKVESFKMNCTPTLSSKNFFKKYPFTFLWKINFTLVRRLMSALIWDISGLWNRSDVPDYREKRIVISRFLALYIALTNIPSIHVIHIFWTWTKP